MSDLRKAAEMALEALDCLPWQASPIAVEATKALRQALAQPEQEPVAWMPIDSAPKGRIVLVYYKNSLGNGRTMRARYYLPETLDSDSTESGWADEGWYEESEAYEYLMPLEYEPTHWMPLPAAPDTQLTHIAPPKRERKGLTDDEILDVLIRSRAAISAIRTDAGHPIKGSILMADTNEYLIDVLDKTIEKALKKS